MPRAPVASSERLAAHGEMIRPELTDAQKNRIARKFRFDIALFLVNNAIAGMYGALPLLSFIVAHGQLQLWLLGQLGSSPGVDRDEYLRR